MSHDDFGLGLHDINNAGVYAIDSEDIGALAAAMRDAGLKVIRIDLEGVTDKRTLLARHRTRKQRSLETRQRILA